ncbi:MAG: beta-ketoacyl synthase N-terminal-like domain-containing protein, partial [Desulfobacterales bacterium]
MSRDTAIAIVGVAGVFPAADDLETFWHNIAAKRCAIAPVPSRRWGVPTEQIQAAEICADRIRSLKAGLIEAVPFEPELFDLPRDLKTALDPLHRLVLTAGRAAWHDCVHNPVDHTRVGVILASIALPTETASRLTRKVLTYLLESKIFASASPVDPPAIDPAMALASRVTSLPAALLASAL